MGAKFGKTLDLILDINISIGPVVQPLVKGVPLC